MELLEYLKVSLSVVTPISLFVWWVNKREITLECKTSEEAISLKFDKKIADLKIEFQKEVIDYRDRMDRRHDELMQNFLTLGSKLDIFYKALTEDVGKNTYEIGKLKQAKEDRDKHFENLRDEMRDGFRTISERLDRVIVGPKS